MLKASSQQNNVGKGSRQPRSVTSGKGLAPRIHDSYREHDSTRRCSTDCGTVLRDCTSVGRAHSEVGLLRLSYQ
jgi:hypothetical protein